MARFEASMKNPELIEAVRGLSPLAIRIAEDPAACGRLNDFMTMYVEPDRLSYFDGNATYVYKHRYLSAVGIAGSLLHVRINHGDDGPAPEHRQVAAVVASVNDDERLSLLDATLEHRSSFDGTRSTTVRLDPAPLPPFDAMRADDETDTMYRRRELDWWLEASEWQRDAPEVTVAQGGWTYKHATGMQEPLRDLLRIHGEVNEALRRGFGEAALVTMDVEQDQGSGTGHFSRKVVA